ncbi:MAG: ArnT family glycosyltransferase [Desulfosoma sp.]|uniref:ArnT family glycosyltransferase n=1 Tax=Desulfosoma sp. TaxID=2603217 RepID=UPI0040498EB2
MDEPRSGKGLLWWAVLCAVIGTVAFQGSRGLYESTEGRYAECAREMIVSGDYLRPTLDFAPHWTKPPFTYWAIASGVKVLGRNAWGARAFLVPTFVLTVFAVYWLARHLWDRSKGALTALVYATMWGPVGAASTINADSLLTLWETLALACFWWGVRSRREYPIILMWLFWGLAFFTKGPPALLPLLAVVAFRILVRDDTVCSVRFFVPAGVGLGLAVGLWWYLWAVVRYPGLLTYWLKHEVVSRVATDEFRRYAKWYHLFTVYWPFLLGGSLPWLAVVGWIDRAGLWESLQSVRRGGPRGIWERVTSTLKNTSAPALFLSCIFFIPLFVFSISRSRLPLYVLPLCVAVSCLLGWKIACLADRGRLTRQHLLRLALAGTAVVVLGKGLMAHWPSKRDMGAVALALQAAWPEKESSDRAPLYLVSKAPCYGLQFYWGDPVIRVHPKWQAKPSPGLLPLSSLTKNGGTQATGLSSGRKILTRVENGPVLEEQFRQEGYQVISKALTRHWKLLELTP